MGGAVPVSCAVARAPGVEVSGLGVAVAGGAADGVAVGGAGRRASGAAPASEDEVAGGAVAVGAAPPGPLQAVRSSPTARRSNRRRERGIVRPRPTRAPVTAR